MSDKTGSDESAPGGALQGEGNYDAARRHRKSVGRFIAEGKVEPAAANAQPKSEREARDLADAEDKGLEHSQGEDEDDEFVSGTDQP